MDENMTQLYIIGKKIKVVPVTYGGVEVQLHHS
jgi:hypothetical protein